MSLWTCTIAGATTMRALGVQLATRRMHARAHTCPVAHTHRRWVRGRVVEVKSESMHQAMRRLKRLLQQTLAMAAISSRETRKMLQRRAAVVDGVWCSQASEFLP